MSKPVIKVENLSKQYRLGVIGTGTLSHDLNRWWHRVRGKEDPYLKIGESNDRSRKGESDLVWALKDINFEVNQGEVLGIIGKNGAGKSTLLKILSKVTGPTTGRIMAKGRIASLLEVGTGFHPELTGRENIYLNGTILGMSKSEVRKKLDEIVDFAGVERYLDTPVKRYSSGMKVRLGFAVAAHLEPEILIVDEVLAVGDAEFQKKAIGKMQEVSYEGGRTVLFVSHNMGSIRKLCNSILIIKKGKKAFYGDTPTGISKYLEEEVLLLSNGNEFNFNLVKDRTGMGDIVFSSLKVESIQNSKTSRDLRTGAMVNIIFELFNKSQKIRKDIIVSIGFFNQYGNFLFACRSDVVGKTYQLRSNKMIVKLMIKKFPLIKGKYYISLICYSKNIVMDWIKNYGPITVNEGNFYNTDKIPASKHKGVLIEYEYKNTTHEN